MKHAVVSIVKQFEALWSNLKHCEVWSNWIKLQHCDNFEALWNMLKHCEAFWSIGTCGGHYDNTDDSPMTHRWQHWWHYDAPIHWLHTNQHWWWIRLHTVTHRWHTEGSNTHKGYVSLSEVAILMVHMFWGSIAGWFDIAGVAMVINMPFIPFHHTPSIISILYRFLGCFLLSGDRSLRRATQV